ncbi:MAG: CapA family protein [Candidatus Tectomicrobia bacterium]|nr:CapA family protein [Candidatus Tectomicrobia bacterium]
MGFHAIQYGNIQPDPDTLVMAAGGDILIKESLSRLQQEKGPEYLFSCLKPVFHRADIVFANLETPLLKEGKKNSTKNPNYPFFKNDPSLAEALRSAGFTLLCLANNHILDYGLEGLRTTCEALNGQGIQFVGAGLTAEESCRPVSFSVKGYRITFLAYSLAYAATGSSGGCAPLKEEVMLQGISKVRAHSDIIVISLHHGIEYSDYPIPESRQLNKRLAAAGADIILGHHPHVMQGMEVFANSIMIHSMGSLIYDNTPEQDKQALRSCLLVKKGGIKFPENDSRTREGMIFLFGFHRNKAVTIQMVPVVQDYREIPKIPEERAYQDILRHYQRISNDLLSDEYPNASLLQQLSAVEYLSELKNSSATELLWKLSRARPRHLRHLWFALKHYAKGQTV